MKLRTLALCLALAACNRSSSVESASGTGVADKSGEGEVPQGRSGKIDLPSPQKSAPSGDAPAIHGEARRGDRTRRFDKDGDGTLSDAERDAMRDARRDERMKRLDTDEDGKVSEEERQAAQQEREDRRAARMAQLDTDGDGQVSDAERSAAMAGRAKEMHGRLDADGDGKLTPAEVANARRLGDDPTKADANGDGTVTVEELQKAMSERRGSDGFPRDDSGRGRRGQRNGDGD